jgi:hypothetical protein
MKAYNAGWPTFDGKCGGPTGRHTTAWQRTMAANTRCVNDEAKMIGNAQSLCEMWNMTDMCYERPEKYTSEAFWPVSKVSK